MTTFTLKTPRVEDITVNRLGFGAMRITGPGIWDYPADIDNAIKVLKRTKELGVDFIDTADSYGPETSEDLIARALHPYGKTIIATKAGLTRQGPDVWTPVGNPNYLKQCLELSLRRLKVDSIDLYQLHRIDGNYPLEDQLGVFKTAQIEGKIKHFGLSEVSVEQIHEAQKTISVASVQNLYNVGNRGHTHAQLSLAWLLQKSPVMLPIPGTASISHLEENMKAANITLDAQTMSELDTIAKI
jgi:aryl-alcohol dehydrogenase-like predicted oxidoreductase